MAAQGAELPPSNTSYAPIRKRPRPVQSCVDCRLKKLKCNRETPCDSCTRSGRSGTCSYDASIGSISQSAQPSDKRIDASPAVKRLRGESPSINASSYSSPNGVNSPAGHFHHPSPPALRRVSSVTGPATRTEVANVAQNDPTQTAVYLGHFEALEARIKKLEEFNDSQSPSNPENSVPAATFSLRHRSVLVKKNTRSRFKGPNDVEGLFSDFPMVWPFIERKIKEPDTRKLIDSLLDFFPKKAKRVFNGVPFEREVSLVRLQEILPPQAICDTMITTYLREFEQCFRILHRGTFVQNYAEYWQAQPSPASSFATFIPQLALVLVLSYFADNNASACRNTFWSMDKSFACCELVTSWLSGRSGKDTIEFSIICTMTLLVMALGFTENSVSDQWVATGSLIRSAMVMGLHIDPLSIKGVTPFYAIQRRRVWTSILELDLQAAIACGLPPAIRGDQLDMGSLIGLNVNDSILSSDMELMPANISQYQNTDSTYQLLLAGSLKERLEIAYMVTAMKNDVNDLDAALGFCRHIENELDKIPRVLQIHDDYPECNQILSRIMVAIKLQRPLLAFHRPLLASDLADHALRLESRRVCIQQSLSILTQLDSIDPEIANPNIIQTRDCWDHFLRVCSRDVIEAIQGVCLAIQSEDAHTTTHAHTGSSQFPPTPVSMVSTPLASSPQLLRTHGHEFVAHATASPLWTFTNLSRVVDSALTSLVSRMENLAGNMKPMFGLCIVYEYVRARTGIESRDAAMTAGIYRFFKTCQRRYVIGDQIEPHHRHSVVNNPSMVETTTSVGGNSLLSNVGLAGGSDITQWQFDAW